MRQKVRWNIEMSVALFFIEKNFFLYLSGFAGCFGRATENAMKKNFAVALSHSTFALANLRTLRTSLQALFDLLLHLHIA